MRSILAVVLLGSVAALPAPAQTHYQRLHSFGFTNLVCALPYCALIQGRDGAIYGTSASLGPVFKFSSDGTGLSVLRLLNTPPELLPSDALYPRAGLLQASDSALYGTSYYGGGGSDAYGTGLGTVFKLNPDGSGYLILRGFTTNFWDGAHPYYAVPIEGDDGALYATTSGGGTNNAGVIFKLNKDGSHFMVLHAFGGGSLDGKSPYAGLIKASDGKLYGTTISGGISNSGTVFKLNQDGSGYSTIYSFGAVAADGSFPTAAALEGRDGALYGTTYSGGANGKGAVYKLNKDGSGYSILYNFKSSNDGANPFAGLIQAADNTLFGTTYGGTTNQGTPGGTIFRLNPNGSGYALMHSFDWDIFEGAAPYGGLLLASNHVLYGATWGGGSAGGGSIFKINPDGTGFATLFNLSDTGGDGILWDSSFLLWVYSGLVEGSDGAVYGSTGGWRGGGHTKGTIFKLNKDGSGYTNIYNFAFSGDDGSNAVGVIEASDHALYGTAVHGGTNLGNPGTLFRLNKDGSGFMVLHQFNATAFDGLRPYAAVIEGSDGALYGTTRYGGANNAGTVFRSNKDGTGYSVMYSFGSSGSDGQQPQASLLQASDGMLYGSTGLGGNGSGTLFRLKTDW